MSTLHEAATAFLNQKRIAVAGVSRKGDTAATAVYNRLKRAGYEVFPVNPHAAEVAGDRCYPDLASIPGGVTAVMVATHPDHSAGIVQQCADQGIRHVWFHRSLGQGSVSDEAVEIAERHGIPAIPGSCPMMFLDPVDPAHRCLKWFLRVSGREPEPIEPAGSAIPA